MDDLLAPDQFPVRSGQAEALALARTLQDADALERVENRVGWWVAVYADGIADRMIAPAA